MVSKTGQNPLKLDAVTTRCGNNSTMILSLRIDLGLATNRTLNLTASRSVRTERLRTWATQTPDITAFLAQAVEEHLLALELEPAAFLAIVPSSAMPSEISLAVVGVLVLRHDWD